MKVWENKDWVAYKVDNTLREKGDSFQLLVLNKTTTETWSFHPRVEHVFGSNDDIDNPFYKPSDNIIFCWWKYGEDDFSTIEPLCMPSEIELYVIALKAEMRLRGLMC